MMFYEVAGGKCIYLIMPLHPVPYYGIGFIPFACRQASFKKGERFSPPFSKGGTGGI